MKDTTRRLTTAIFTVSLTVLCCLLFTGCDPALPLNPKYSYTSFELDLGTEVNSDIAEYVDFSDVSAEDEKFIRDNTEILYDGESADGAVFGSAGDHTLTIMYKDHQYRQYNILVTDNVPPKIKAVGDTMYTFVGLPLDDSMIGKHLFKASDNSGKVKISIPDPEINYDKAGKYAIKAIATDPSGNTAEAETYVIVQEPKYGAEGTYVYVSISKQHLTYFVNGKPDMDCPVVTGNAGNHSTPKGTFRLIYKSRNQKLKGREDNGDEYESFVNYWMAFIGSAYGLHDATWRSNFGGNIYQGAGSHGCVNMPYKSAGELYGKIEPGTPILVY